MTSRRELLGNLARWSVPTVVTITLGSRVLEAKASCPPCQKRQAGVCRACTVSQILNCQCEPCLGPPYCQSVGSVQAMPQSGALSQPYPQQGVRPGAQAPTLAPYTVPRGTGSPMSDPLFRDPFGLDKRVYGQPSVEAPGLYQRLRPDTLPTRRLP